MNENVKQRYFKRHQVENSPFEIIETESVCFAAIGITKITEDMNTVAEVKAKLKKKDWNTIVNVVAYVTEKFYELKQIENELKEPEV